MNRAARRRQLRALPPPPASLLTEDRQPVGTAVIPSAYLAGIASPHACFVEGDCLTPIGLVDGDTVILDTANTRPQPGEVIACRLNGVLLLKAYMRHGDRDWLCYFKDGRKCAASVGPGDTLEIIGVVARVVASGLRRWPQEDNTDQWVMLRREGAAR